MRLLATIVTQKREKVVVTSPLLGNEQEVNAIMTPAENGKHWFKSQRVTNGRRVLALVDGKNVWEV